MTGKKIAALAVAMILLLATVVILARHGENYRRMGKGTELSLRSVFQGKPKGKGQ